ncbi:MAG: HNH endonuclease [Rhizorhabdus sp.]|uniref:HNH endonuclease n=1 Tax=Rhizorhabdus sp. TaxID=1968843 RepID=UPI001B41FE10|nr:HNH endonuclease signature motif containing protein [Rhizorhabdus sp.]MBP8234487.1 HNH endonuclease [Rhizorhabdus sp.]
MARSVKEWVGRNDDTPPSEACKRRIMARQENLCALTGRPFTAKEKPQFDHKVPLWLGGQNRESNLHAIHKAEHAAKTSAEAKVRAKVNANTSKHFGLRERAKKPVQSRNDLAFGKPKSPKPQLAPRALYEARQ